MTYILVDIEADGPAPGLYSMVSFGAVAITGHDESAWPTFYGQTRPLDGASWIPDALAVSGHTRDEHLGFDDPATVMRAFAAWVRQHGDGRPQFVSDNNGFDWQFINYYLWAYVGSNPFGHSSTNLGSLYKGAVADMRKNFKHLRRAAHTHHPVDDALGNAQALMTVLARHRIISPVDKLTDAPARADIFDIAEAAWDTYRTSHDTDSLCPPEAFVDGYVAAANRKESR